MRALAVVVALVAGLGLWIIGQPDDLRREHVVRAGVPLTEVHPAAGGSQQRPGVVVAHGYAGSARLMAPFADSLAARGYVVVLPDFSGHGANTHRTGDLYRDLDVALAHLRGLSDVDPSRIALVGHSMGATVVTRYAATHPDITTTVAISLPAAMSPLPDRLLVMVGAYEFPGFHEAARSVVGSQIAVRGERKAVVVQGVEHISVLFAPRTHRETVRWLDRTFGRTSEGPLPLPLSRLAGAGLLLIALLTGLLPLARLLLGPAVHDRPRLDAPLIGRVAPVAAGAAVAGVLIALLTPLGLSGYLSGFAAVTGVTLLVYARLRGPSLETATARGHVLAAPALCAYTILTIALPTHLGLTHALPAGARWWVVALMWLGFGILGYASQRATAGNALAVLVVAATAVVVLTWAAALDVTPGFVLMIVPLLAILLLSQTIWAAVLHRHGAPAWLIAMIGGLLVAWPLATALPLEG